MLNTSPSVIKNRLYSWAKVGQFILNGLDGDQFSWSSGEFEAYKKKAQAMGITLVTKTWLSRNGYRLKRGVKPIGNAYFLAPISKFCDLYVLECQAVKDE